MSEGNISERIGAYAASMSYKDLPEEVIHQVKRLTVDSFGCGLRSFDSPPAEAAKAAAAGVTGPHLATILGTKSKTTSDLAAFVNGTMVRFLDYNDTYIMKDTGHPSDAIPVVLAAAEAEGLDGKAAILGIVLAYEMQAAWIDTWPGDPWDQAVQGIISMPVGVGKVMGLTAEQISHAVRLSVACGVVLEGARGTGGGISHLKASTMAIAGKNAIFYAQLARNGYTGPTEIFEGPSGYFATLVHEKPSMAPLTGERERPAGFRIMQSGVKRYPSGHPSQEFIEATIECRKALEAPSLDQVENIHVRTYKKGYTALFPNESRWTPENRETADHSGPFVVTIALRDGNVDPGHFEREEFKDPKVLAVMEKVTGELDPECVAGHPDKLLNIVTVKLKDGRSHTARVEYHRGHYKNPMSDKELEEKFTSCTEKLLSPERRRAALDAMWNLDKAKDLTTFMHQLVL